MNPLIEAKGLEKKYGVGRKTVKAVVGVNFAVARGDCVAISGKSGSGKTTLLNIIGALEDPTAGEIFFNGEKYAPVSSDASSSARRRKMGFVFQSHNLLADFTALENASFPCLIAGMGKSESFARAEQFLRDVGLTDKITSFPDELSGGQQQRVAIARALVMEPELVLADEPTGNLDPRTSMLVADVMLSMREKLGAALIAATHSSELSARFGRKLHMRNGTLTNA